MSNFPFRRLQAELAEMLANLPAESRLPSEPDLARRMGVSRATLREAMRSFEVQGLIRRRQGVGTFVVARVPVIESGVEVLRASKPSPSASVCRSIWVSCASARKPPGRRMPRR